MPPDRHDHSVRVGKKRAVRNVDFIAIHHSFNLAQALSGGPLAPRTGGRALRGAPSTAQLSGILGILYVAVLCRQNIP